MRLVKCNGRRFEVFELGRLLYRLEAGGFPLKLNGVYVVDDAVADSWFKELQRAMIEAELPRIAGKVHSRA
jgi:hypothetical protein